MYLPHPQLLHIHLLLPQVSRLSRENVVPTTASFPCPRTRKHTLSIKKRHFSHHIFPDPGCGIGAFSIEYGTLNIINTITIAKGYTIINTLTAIECLQNQWLCY
ncbi:hypothetical protein ACSQ67_014450 [Phaseolus vulgaris]